MPLVRVSNGGSAGDYLIQFSHGQGVASDTDSFSFTLPEWLNKYTSVDITCNNRSYSNQFYGSLSVSINGHSICNYGPAKGANYSYTGTTSVDSLNITSDFTFNCSWTYTGSITARFY